MFTLAKQSKSSHGWFKGFPYAHPDPTLPAVIFNDQLDMFKSRDVRWALALLIDIKAVSMASYRGAATISAIGVPPTGSAPDVYHAPLESWLQDFEIDTGKQQDQALRSDRRQADRRHAAAVDGRSDPDQRRRDRQVVRPRLVEAQPAGGAGAAGARRLHQEGRQVVHARRQAVHHQAHGRGRRPAGHDPRRQHDRPAVAPVRHRRHDGGGAGQHGRPPRRRRLRGDDHLERRDLGRPSRPVVLPRQLALAVRRRSPASRSRRATGSAGPTPSSTRSSSRSARSASTIPRDSSSAATT